MQLMREKRYKFWIVFAVSLFFTLITLFARENVFLSDNGDYTRVLRLCSMYKTDAGDIKISVNENTWISAVPKILFSASGISTYPSSHLFFVRIAGIINLFANAITGAPIDKFNIFYLGLMYSILYATALSFTLCQIRYKNKKHFFIFCFICICMMCDIAYVSYFNSLYGEGLQHILFIFLIGFFIRIFKDDYNKLDVLLFYSILLLYGTSKAFNIPCAILMGIAYLILAFHKNLTFRVRMISALSMGITFLMLLFFFMAIPKWIKTETNYNSVFFGILKECSDKEAMENLESLGLSQELYQLKDTNRYVSNSAEIEARYDLADVEKLSYVDLCKFYITHPKKLLKLVPHIAQFCGILRNHFFLDSKYMDAPQRLTVWSQIRENGGFSSLWINILLWVAFLISAGFLLYKQKYNKQSIISLLSIVITCTLYTFVSPYIANGEGDLGKHMFVFMEYMDILFIFLLAMFFEKNVIFKIPFGVIIACILIGLVFTKTYAQAEFVEFGKYKGEELTWMVIDETAEYKTLITVSSVEVEKYSEEPNNFYEESFIRKWLNSEFLSEFTQDEREKMLEIKHKVLHSKAYRERAETGKQDFYCCLFPELSARGYNMSYGSYVTDKVVLPNVIHIEKMKKKDYKINDLQRFWLETPYFNNSEKVRFLNTDSFIYFAPANEKMGIRPVIHLAKH